MKPKIKILVLFFVLFCLKRVIGDVELVDGNEKRARIIRIDKNIIFHAGVNKNINFNTTNGGKIYIDEKDIINFNYFGDYSFFSNLSKIMGHPINIQLLNSALFKRKISRLDETSQKIKEEHFSIAKEITEIQNKQKNHEDQLKNYEMNLMRFGNYSKSLVKSLTINGCDSNQCKNGGKCIPKIGNQFLCLCPHEFSGQYCEDDVDECLQQSKTCQNNGTCVNKENGFSCKCLSGFHGPKCEFSVSTCSETHNLCGPHGTCIDQDSTYDCHCHHGFQKSTDLENPTCVDIDECLTNPCQIGIECINFDGSYQCYGCPKGYKMGDDGCIDINECEKTDACMEGVTCRNLPGSYECGSCPPGTTGDGKTGCTAKHICESNPCGYGYACFENPNSLHYDGYDCICRNGKEDEYGDCVRHQLCQPDSCALFGTCTVVNDTNFKCVCDSLASGERCENLTPCALNVCINGKCVMRDGIAHCKCNKHFYGKHCENHETDYDEHFTELSGIFEKQIIEKGVYNIKNMYFRIDEPNSVLKIKFSIFSGFKENSTGCRDANSRLLLYDGPNENYPLLKTWCGEPPDAPILGHNITLSTTHAFLKYEGYEGIFSGTYTVDKSNCGYRTKSSAHPLVVPGYKSDIVCEWFISAPQGKAIEITIPKLNMDSTDCKKNKLELHDGISASYDPVIKKFCENITSSKTYKTTGSFLTVLFHVFESELYNKSGGFSMKFRFVDDIEMFDCDSKQIVSTVLVEQSGYIESPNYGSLYPPCSRRDWKIQGDPENVNRTDLVMKLDFELIDIPSYYKNIFGEENLTRISDVHGEDSVIETDHFMSFKCFNDTLILFSEDGSFHGEVCGQVWLSEIYLSQPNLFISFRSDKSVQGKGFRFKYEILCYKELSGNGIVKTWDFPTSLKSGTCVYHLKAHKKHMINITFKKILMNTDCHNLNPTNYIEIENSEENLSLRFICKNETFHDNQDFTFHATDHIKITVVSDGSNKFRGLAFDYVTKNINCGGQIISEFKSPSYPENYPANIKCDYFHNDGRFVKTFKITFDDFDLPYSCEEGNLTLYTSESSSAFRTLCGNSFSNSPIILTAQKLTLKFISSNTVSRGFKGRIEVLPAESTCDATYHQQRGVIPLTNHNLNNCTYKIIVEHGQKIVIHLRAAMIPCSTSLLQIIDGKNDNNPILFCNKDENNQSRDYRLFSNEATIHYTSTDPENADVYIRYEVIAGCGSTLQGYQGIVTAPQYPHKENRNVTCDWKIAVSHGNRVNLTIEKVDELNGYPEEKCETGVGNSLEIVEYLYQHVKSHGVYCHRAQNLPSIISESEIVDIKYLQNINLNQKVSGFILKYTTHCKNIRINKSYGIIQSPGYQDENSFETQDCSWNIEVPLGNRIIITFEKFIVNRIDMESQECLDNVLKIDEANFLNATIDDTLRGGLQSSNIHKYCDLFIPQEIISRHNSMKISYKSESKVENKFMLNYHVLGCVEEISTSQDILIRKTDIDFEYDRFECQYHIKADIEQKITISIESFEVQHNENCEKNKENYEEFTGINMYLGSSNSSGHPRYTVCQINKKMNKEYKLLTSEAFIQILLNRNSFKYSQEILLKASVEIQQKDKMNPFEDIIDLDDHKSIIITSPNYPKIYESEISYETAIKNSEGHLIKLELLNFTKAFDDELEKEEQNGDRKSAELYIQSLSIIKRISTYENYTESFPYSAGIMFFGAKWKPNDGHRAFAGFRMEVKKVCGGLLVAHQVQQSFYMNLEIGETCRIEIQTLMMIDPSSSSIPIHASLEILEEEQNNITNVGKFDEKFRVTSDGSIIDLSAKTLKHISHFKADQVLVFEAIDIRTKTTAIIRYSMTNIDCNGPITREHTIFNFELDQNQECSWILNNTLGNSVSLKITSDNFPVNAHCADSYIEIRDSNSAGEKLYRGCESEINQEFTRDSLFIHFKFSKSLLSDKKYSLNLEMKKIAGGLVKNYAGTLLAPVLDGPKEFLWNIECHELVKITTQHVSLSEGSFIQFSQNNDASESESETEVEPNQSRAPITGLPPDQDFVLEFPKVNIKIVMKPKDDFKIDWKCTYKWDLMRQSDITSSSTTNADCESVVRPTWEWQAITSPFPPNATFGYASNKHCLWKFEQFSEPAASFEMKFEMLNLDEYSIHCFYDFIDIEVDGIKARHCQTNRLPQKLEYRQNEKVAIHFTSSSYFKDNTDKNKGFKLLYKLKCGHLNYDISSPDGIFDHTISSPPHLDDSEDISCNWIIHSSKNRRINVTIDDFDINICEGENWLTIDSKVLKCGNYAQFSYLTTSNFVNISYSSENIENRGFNITVREAFTECPGDIIHLTEDRSRTIFSPEHPFSIPHSSSCIYKIAAPNSHRIMLTFEEFDMEESNITNPTDYLQIRDGPSERSKLIGTYSGKGVHSSIFSSSNFMLMRLHTDKNISSHRFVARVEVATCGGTIVLNERNKEYTLRSPKTLTSGLICEWLIRRPVSYFIKLQLLSIKDYRSPCVDNLLEISKLDFHEIIYNGQGCAQINNTIQEFHEVPNDIRVIFDSKETKPNPGFAAFEIVFKLSEKKCGGLITDSSGTLTIPFFSRNSYPHCVWNFKAEPGFIWMIYFDFKDKEMTNFNHEDCFKDLTFFDYEKDYSISQTNLCRGHTSYVSYIDTLKIELDDSYTRKLFGLGKYPSGQYPYANFELEYEKIPREIFDSCSHLITSNSTFNFDKDLETNRTKIIEFCHLSIPKAGESSTVSVKISNFKSKSGNVCQKNQTHMVLSTSSIEKLICPSESKDLLFNNEQIDFYIGTQSTSDFELILNISFLDCGGHITDPMYAQISSPSSGPCRWLFEAPVGQTVQITISKLICGISGQLTIAEGNEFEPNVIHTYCENSFEKFENTIKVISSKNRFLTMIWNMKDVQKLEKLTEWKLEYEFVNENDVCGYVSKGSSGVIHTRNYSVSQYLPNQKCEWFIRTPIGYHVKLHYTFFDIEESKTCVKDGLYITQEFGNREETNPAICGHDLPADFESKNRNLKVTFKSDAQNNGRGFNLEWKAVCGEVFEENEGIVTSPNYPSLPEGSYNCKYEINVDGLIEFNFDDFHLPPRMYQRIPSYSHRKDYGYNGGYFSGHGRSSHYRNHRLVSYNPACIEITSANLNKLRICADYEITKDVTVMKGPVTISLSASTVTRGRGRGFKLSYKKIDCNQNIHLSESTQLFKLIERPKVGLHHFECLWKITTTPDRHLVVHYQKFNTAPDCFKDYVGFEGEVILSEHVCGNITQFHSPDLFTRESSLNINMVYNYINDEYMNNGAVQLLITSTPKCGQKLYASETWQSFTLPNISSEIGYPPNLYCQWEMFQNTNHRLHLFINSMDDKSRSCMSDRLTIIDGFYEEYGNRIVHNACNDLTLPYEIETSGFAAVIIFKSENGGSGSGFNITYKAEDAGCTSILYANNIHENKSVSIDAEPHIKKLKKCRYTMVSADEQILLKFSKFNIPSNCEKNYVEIHNGEPLAGCLTSDCLERNRNLHRMKFCGNHKIPMLISNRRNIQMTVQFENKPNMSVHFDYQLFTDCNRTIDIVDFPSGRLTSPNFPHAYNLSKTCTTKFENSSWPLFTPKLLIIFESILGNSAKMIEFNEEEVNNTQQFVGDLNKKPIFTKGGATVDMIFKTEKIADGLGYEASYYSVIHENENVVEYARNHDFSGVLNNQDFPRVPEKHIFTVEPPKNHNCKFEIIPHTALNDDVCRNSTNLIIEKYIDNKLDSSRKYPKNCPQTRDSIILEKNEQSRYLKFEFLWNENAQPAHFIEWMCDNLED